MAGKRIDDWLRMSEAALYYYKQTGHKVPTMDTVRNWIKKGRGDYAGVPVKLRGERRGNQKGLWITRKVWMDEFIERLKAPVIGV